MNQTQQKLTNELIRRQMARSSLDDYANYMASSQHLDFLHPPAKHHRLMTRALDLLLLPPDHPNHPKDEHGEPITKLLITAPPGSAKSTYISVQFATYYLMLHPDHHVLCSSNVGTLAESFNRRRRSACMTQEWQNLSETTLDPEARGVDQFFTLRGGSIKASGVGAAIVGVRSNLNILDDPIESWEQAQSETQLSKIWDWYETEYRSRLVPNGLEVLMHQRWSRNDPAGVLLRLIKSGEERGWAVINLPLIATDDDPLRRSEGEVLWPEWFTERQVKEAQRDPAKWAALYQQHPLDEEGGWVGQEHIRYIQPHEWAKKVQSEPLKYIAAGDIALSVNKGDWTVLIICAITPERDLVICDVLRHRKSIEDSVSELYKLQGTYQPTGWLFDDDNATKVFTRLVYEHARSENLSPPSLEFLPMRGRDKEIRAAAIRGYFRSGRVFVVNDPRWAPDLVREILTFPGEPDDQIDTLGLIGRKMVQLTGNDLPKPPRSQQVQGLIVEKEGRLHLNLGLDELFADKERGGQRWNTLQIR